MLLKFFIIFRGHIIYNIILYYIKLLRYKNLI
nr:MAG TPA: hypothetical protein [Caudoviricetes sp.]